MRPEQAAMVIERSKNRLGMFFRDKPAAVEMQIVGKAFGIGTLLGADLPTDTEFVDEWYTTLGPIVYRPGNYTPTMRSLRVLTHEFGHGAAFRDRGAQMATEYISSTAWRGLYELDAAMAQWEVEHYLCGELPSEGTIRAGFRHGYAISDEHAPFQTSVALARLSLTRDGIYATKVANVVIEELRREGFLPGHFASRAAMEAA